jgi:RNA polymerase sigma-70 factor, ECF subfamily
MTPEELWLEAVRGHQPSWNRLFELFGGRLHQFFLKNCGRPETAADLTQETFVRLYRHREKFQTGQLKTWIFRIARNLLIDEWRRHARSEVPTDTIPDRVDPATPIEEGLIESLEHSRVLEVLDLVLTELPEYERIIIGLIYLGGLSIPDLSSIMEIPLGTAKTQVRQARMRLERKLVERLQLNREEVAL